MQKAMEGRGKRGDRAPLGEGGERSGAKVKGEGIRWVQDLGQRWG